MKRIISVFLLLAVLLTASACGGAKEQILSGDIEAIRCDVESSDIIEKCKLPDDDRRMLWYCGAESVLITVDGEELELADAIKSRRLSVEEFIAYLEKNDKGVGIFYSDGGSREYYVDSVSVIEFHSLDGNENIAVMPTGGIFNISSIASYYRAIYGSKR